MGGRVLSSESAVAKDWVTEYQLAYINVAACNTQGGGEIKTELISERASKGAVCTGAYVAFSVGGGGGVHFKL